MELNKVLKRKVFKTNALYISALTLWEVMQPIGGKGKHHHHGLSSENVYDALAALRLSSDISLSYGDRYLIITVATIFDDVNLAVVITPKGTIAGNAKREVNKVITIYPYKKK